MGKSTRKHLKKNKESRRKLPVVFGLAAAILLGAAVWGVAAKYTKESSSSAVVRAREFYFSSDILVEGGTVYRLNPGTTSVSFTLSRFEDALRSAEDTVSYRVETTGGSLSSTAGIIENDDVTVTLSGLLDGGSYTVTAVGSAGYEKTLSATFEVQESPKSFYMYLDTYDAAYVLLTVWTGDCAGDVTVAFPGGLIPDATDSELAAVVNYDSDSGTYSGQSVTHTYGEYESRTYRFFKQNRSAAYGVGDFVVTLNGTNAVVKSPD